MTQRPDLSKLTHAEKDALIYALLDRLERAEERIKELERRLGLDSSNSSKPPSSDGYKKPPKPQNLREKTGKKSGGQEGHQGTNLRQVEKPDHIVDHCPDVCGWNNRQNTPNDRCSTFQSRNPSKSRNTARIVAGALIAG